MCLSKLILETTKHISSTTDQNYFHIKATWFFHQIYKVSILIPPENQNTTNIYFSVQHTPRFLLKYCRQHHFSHTANRRLHFCSLPLALPLVPLAPHSSTFTCLIQALSQPFHLLSCCQRLRIKSFSHSVRLVSPEWNRKHWRTTEDRTLVAQTFITSLLMLTVMNRRHLSSKIILSCYYASPLPIIHTAILQQAPSYIPPKQLGNWQWDQNLNCLIIQHVLQNVQVQFCTDSFIPFLDICSVPIP